MRTYKDAMVMAKCLRNSLAAKNVSLSHSECLELVAQEFGFPQWNTLSAKLDVEAGRLHRPEEPLISLRPPIAVLRVASLEEAIPFYIDFLGFHFDFDPPPAGSTHTIISRSNVNLHLSANAHRHGGAGMLIRMGGLDALHRELSGKSSPFSPSEISFTPWDSRVFHVIDPFGNGIEFWENNRPGIAQPLSRQGRRDGLAQ
jgi:hypothetical protein